MLSTGGTLGEIPKKSYEVIVATRNAFTEATEDVTFSFSLSILVSSFSKKFWMSLSLSKMNFSVFNQP